MNTDVLYATSGLNINTKKAMLHHHSDYLQNVEAVQSKYRTCLLNLLANIDMVRVEYDQLILRAKDNAIKLLNIAREDGSSFSTPTQLDMLKYHASLFTGPGTVQMAETAIAAVPMEQQTIIQPEPAIPPDATAQTVGAAAPPVTQSEPQSADLRPSTFTAVNTPVSNPSIVMPKRKRGGAREGAGAKRRVEATSDRQAQTEPEPLAASLPSPPPSSRTDQAAAEPERETAGGASDTAAVANSESPTEILSSDGEAPPKRARNARTIASLFKRPVTMAMGDSLAEDREYWSNQYKKTRDLLR